MLWEDNYLAHYGIQGQRWGVRRFQNEDGSLTAEGKERYGALTNKANKAKAQARKAETKYLQKKNQLLKYEKKFNDAKLKADKLEQKVHKFEKKFDNWDEISSTKVSDIQNNSEDFKKQQQAKYDRGVDQGKNDFDRIYNSNSPVRSAELEGLLKRASNALGPYADSTYPGYNDQGDAQKQAYDIAICSGFTKKIKGIYDPLNDLGKGTDGHTPETKKLTDQVKKCDDEQQEIYSHIVQDYKRMSKDGSIRSKDLQKIEKEFNDNPKVKDLNKEKASIQKDIQKQILKDMGLPVTAENLSYIYPFIYNACFYDDIYLNRS